MKWNDTYALKIPVIDKQHKGIFDILESLNRSFEEGSTHETSINTLKFMALYIKHHFSAEEKLMEIIKYPELHNQKQMHKEFTVYFSQQINAVKLNHEIKLFALRDFITDWICMHIIREDVKIKRYIESKKKDKEFVAELTREQARDIVGDILTECEMIDVQLTNRGIHQKLRDEKIESAVNEFLSSYEYSSLLELYDKKKVMDSLVEKGYYSAEKVPRYWRQHINPVMLENMLASSQDSERDLLILDALRDEDVISDEMHFSLCSKIK